MNEIKEITKDMSIGQILETILPHLVCNPDHYNEKYRLPFQIGQFYCATTGTLLVATDLATADTYWDERFNNYTTSIVQASRSAKHIGWIHNHILHIELTSLMGEYNYITDSYDKAKEDVTVRLSHHLHSAAILHTLNRLAFFTGCANIQLLEFVHNNHTHFLYKFSKRLFAVTMPLIEAEVKEKSNSRISLFGMKTFCSTGDFDKDRAYEYYLSQMKLMQEQQL